MKKNEFLKALKAQLSFLPRFEQIEVLDYYEELIQEAQDHGEQETEFIDSLGSIEDIIANIKKDGSFLEKIKNKVNISAGDVFDFTVKVIGYFVFFTLAIIIGSIAFSLVVSGISVMGYVGFQIVTNLESELYLQIFRVSEIVLGLGITILGVGLFRWFFKNVKDKLNHLFQKVQDFISNR